MRESFMGRKQLTRIGIVGFGYIGEQLYRHISATDSAMEVAFVHARSMTAVERVPELQRCIALADIGSFSPDLVIEAAHPDVSRQHGPAILRVCDYMPLSVSVLADDSLRQELMQAAAQRGTRLLIPHGALVGCESLLEWQHEWSEVSITFRKPPASLGLQPQDVEKLVYEGSVRGAATRFPRNVNAMVTCALATVGLDACRGRIISDPSASSLSLVVEALGKDGSYLKIERHQPAVGVSGTEMFASLLRSVAIAIGRHNPLEFV